MPACSINASWAANTCSSRARRGRRKNHDHQFGDVLERDRHTTAFGEVTVRGTAGPHTWVAGAAVEADRYTATDVPQFSYAFTTPGVFVQDDVAVKPWLSLSGSARLDHHSEYGTFVSPRVSALLRSGSWNSRASFGTGFFGPSALTEETEAAGLTRLSMPWPLRARRGHERIVRHHAIVWSPLRHTDPVCFARAQFDQSRSRHGVCDPECRAHQQHRRRDADDAPPGAVCADGNLHLRAIARAGRW